MREIINQLIQLNIDKGLIEILLHTNDISQQDYIGRLATIQTKEKQLFKQKQLLMNDPNYRKTIIHVPGINDMEYAMYIRKYINSD